MRRTTFLVSFAALGSAFLTVIPAFGEESFVPIIGWNNQFFPSYLLASSTIRHAEDDEQETDTDDDVVVLGDPQGVLGVKVVATEDDTPIEVTIECKEILDRTTFDGTLEHAGAEYDIYPRIRYHYKALAQNKQSTPVSVTFTVKIGGDEPEVYTTTATVRSVNDCPFARVNPDGGITDMSYMFAAYVNEQHPFIDKVLREALDDGVVSSFSGYQSGKTEDVYRQVYALWNALSERDVRYSSITKSVATNETVYSQHVRLLDESINNGQANCVDGAVLFASLLRKIDIEPILVSLPHHCYVAFYLDKEHTQLVGLETTLLGAEMDENADCELPGVTDVVDDEWQATNSWRTFCTAIESATTDLAANADKFDKDDPDYQLVRIKEARSDGVLPIAFDAASSFQQRTTQDD
ncbi:MAG TPA: hypothetical protein VGN12_17640 [Pirellulales bacterium]|jgi:hypothetical protein